MPYPSPLLVAVEESDLILFVVDARAGILPADKPFAEMARRSGKPVVVIANKAEGGQGMAGAYDAFSLGLGEPVPLSADLNGAKRISLLVDFADRGDERDHADWLNARLVR